MRSKRVPVLGYLCAIFFFASGLTAFSQTLPSLSGETLSGRQMTIPREIYGNPILLVISFSKAAQQQTSDWGKALRADKSEKAQHLKYLQIAELEDVPRLMRGFVRSGIRKGIPSDQQEKFLLLFEGEEQLKRLTKFQKSEDAYILLLDPTGAIRAQDSGPVTPAKLASILEKVPSEKMPPPQKTK